MSGSPVQKAARCKYFKMFIMFSSALIFKVFLLVSYLEVICVTVQTSRTENIKEHLWSSQ